MPVTPTSSRLFAPVTSRPLRIRSAVGVFGDGDDRQEAVQALRRGRAPAEPAPPPPSEVVEALLSALDDADLADLDELRELDTEAFDAVVDELAAELGPRSQRHATGVLRVVA